MKQQRKWAWAVCALALCQSGAVFAQGTIKVALSTAMTGPVSSYGDMHRAGVRQAVEAINVQGGVLGKKIEIVEMDDACNPKQTQEVAHKIINEKISFVLGPLCSGTVAGAAKIYNDHGTLMVVAVASSDDLSTYGHKMFFRTIGRDEQQASLAAEYIVKKIKPKNFAILHENQPYGQGLATQVKKVTESMSVTPFLFDSFKKGETDFSSLIASMKKSGVDAVYYGGYHLELIALLKEAQRQDFQPYWIAPGGVASPAVKGEWVKNLLVTLPPDVSTLPENAKIAEALKAKNRDPAGSFVMTSYASVQVLVNAIVQAKTDDPVKVAEAMRKGEFRTVLGEIRFTPQGDNALARFDIFAWDKDARKIAVH